jgi:hypothetical protein
MLARLDILRLQRQNARREANLIARAGEHPRVFDAAESLALGCFVQDGDRVAVPRLIVAVVTELAARPCTEGARFFPVARRVPDQVIELKPGICVYNPPGEYHSIVNTGDEVLKFIWIYSPQLDSHRKK